MSGGSLEYVFYKVDEAISTIEERGDLTMKAFAEHLKLVSAALRDVEWELSGDGADYKKSIQRVIGNNQDSYVLNVCKKELQNINNQLTNYLQLKS